MNKKDKDKFAKLAAKSQEKNVPAGWVYVGKGGLSLDEKFGGDLIKFSEGRWNQEWPSYSGWNDEAEYACQMKIWEFETGLTFAASPTLENVSSKSVLDYLEELPSPYKELAIYNAVKQGGEKQKARSIDDALSNGFQWQETEQRVEFWDSIYGNCNESNFVWPKIPDRTKVKVLKGYLDKNYEIVLHRENGLTAGCQSLDRGQSVELAREILKFFGEL